MSEMNTCKWVLCICCPPLFLIFALWPMWINWRHANRSTMKGGPTHRDAEIRYWTWTAHHFLFTSEVRHVLNPLDQSVAAYLREHPEWEIIGREVLDWFYGDNGQKEEKVVRFRTRRRSTSA